MNERTILIAKIYGLRAAKNLLEKAFLLGVKAKAPNLLLSYISKGEEYFVSTEKDLSIRLIKEAVDAWSGAVKQAKEEPKDVNLDWDHLIRTYAAALEFVQDEDMAFTLTHRDLSISFSSRYISFDKGSEYICNYFYSQDVPFEFTPSNYLEESIYVLLVEAYQRYQKFYDLTLQDFYGDWAGVFDYPEAITSYFVSNAYLFFSSTDLLDEATHNFSTKLKANAVGKIYGNQKLVVN